MGIRDREIERLVKYAQGMGVKVRFDHTTKGAGAIASWTLDGSEITIYMKANTSKTKVILSLIHEIGHHLWFIHDKNRQEDRKFYLAISRQELFEEKEVDTPTPKELRKKILSVERESTKYWEIIWKETNIQLPKWKLYVAMDLDVWMYEYLYETGKWATLDRQDKKHKELIAKHKGQTYE